ncbi:MAG: PAS domain S-box protein [Nitrospirae bacterium]|nr:PAS domain S-box protein [Nitrospirota bacterium]
MADRAQPAYPVDKLKALHELSIAVNSSFSFTELVETVVIQIVKFVTPDVVFFYLRENDKLLLKSSYQRPGGYSGISPEIKKVGVCLCGHAASEKKPLYSKSINKDPLCTLSECKQAGIQSVAALPLHGVNDIIGVLSLASFTSRDFGEEGTFIETLANHISVALQNILFREVLERKVEELNKLAMSTSESEERFRILLDQGYDGIFIHDNFIILDLNQRMADMTGYSCSELLQTKAINLFTPDSQKLIYEYIRAGRQGFYEVDLQRRDGQIVQVEAFGAPCRYRGHNARIVAIRDITEQKTLQAQLLQAQKMEAIGLLAGGIAHDFNNILTAIIGFGSIVKMKMKNDDPLRVHIEQILESANRAAQLTHSLLAFSRKQPLLMKAVDLNKIITRMETLLKRLIGEDIKLITKTSGNELTVLADSVQIEQVLMNLATNARDAMPGCGSLTISSDSVEFDSEYISAYGFGEPGMYAVISVADTGAGIDKEAIEKIFEPFFSTKEVGKGSGLGLAVVYGIIKQHNGHINVYSETGKGTTFKIYLPLIKAKSKEEDKRPAKTPQSGTETILVAEDDGSLRKLMEIVLKASGYKVITSVDGEDAINKFMENREAVHLCLLDVIMPKKSGIDVYYEIKKARPDIRVVFMSGYTADVMNKSTLPDEDAVLLLKPVEPQALLRKIREILDK